MSGDFAAFYDAVVEESRRVSGLEPRFVFVDEWASWPVGGDRMTNHPRLEPLARPRWSVSVLSSSYTQVTREHVPWWRRLGPAWWRGRWYRLRQELADWIDPG